MERHILVADDMAINRMLIRNMLKKKLADVVFHDAEDGFQALDMVKRRDFDLIILDLMMPGKDGFGVLEELKASAQHRDIPVVICSALDDMISIHKALNEGAYDYFTKPFTAEQMHFFVPAKIRNALNSYINRKQITGLHQRMNTELQLAATFQKMLISPSQRWRHGRMYGRYMPCDAVGGDYYECLEIDNTLWFIIADVAGHGVASAMMSSMLKVEFEKTVRDYHSPAAVLLEMNRNFCRISNSDYYLTTFIGRLSSGQLTYANAAHPYPVLWNRHQGKISLLEQRGFPVGLFEEAEYEEETIDFQDGDRIMMYTDGLLDWPVADGQTCGPWRLLEYFAQENKLAGEITGSFFQDILQYVRGNNEAVPVDDIAIMIVEATSK